MLGSTWVPVVALASMSVESNVFDGDAGSLVLQNRNCVNTFMIPNIQVILYILLYTTCMRLKLSVLYDLCCVEGDMEVLCWDRRGPLSSP